jgi:hypothetical protein
LRPASVSVLIKVSEKIENKYRPTHFSYKEVSLDPNIHATGDQLEQYALGSLPDSDVPRLEEHLLVCAACRDRIDEIAEFTLGLREAVRNEPLPAASPQPDWFAWFRRPAFSMAVGLAALIIFMAVFSNRRTKFAPAASIQLTAMRGEMTSSVPARELNLTLSDAPREGGPFRVEVVNAIGQTMWSGLAESSPKGVQVKVQQQLAPGDYFVRIYTSAGKVIHEYGFRIRT